MLTDLGCESRAAEVVENSIALHATTVAIKPAVSKQLSPTSRSVFNYPIAAINGRHVVTRDLLPGRNASFGPTGQMIRAIAIEPVCRPG